MERVPPGDDISDELTDALTDTSERMRELSASDDGVSAKTRVVDYYDGHGIFDLAYKMQKSLVCDLIGLVSDASQSEAQGTSNQ